MLFRSERPKHIFLVHGEKEAQETLKEKILEDIGIDVTIPEYGETYELNEEIVMTNKIERRISSTLRREVMDRLNLIKREMLEMEEYVKQDVLDMNLKEQDMFRINEKMKELEKQILNVVEG